MAGILAGIAIVAMSAASAAAQPAAWFSQGGGETPLAFAGGCVTTGNVTQCGLFPAGIAGPTLVIAPRVPATVRFGEAVDALSVEFVDGQGRPANVPAPRARRIDAQRWAVVFAQAPAGYGIRLATDGPGPSQAAFAATTGAAEVSRVARGSGGVVRVTVRTASGGALAAYVAMHGRRRSPVARAAPRRGTVSKLTLRQSDGAASASGSVVVIFRSSGGERVRLVRSLAAVSAS